MDKRIYWVAFNHVRGIGAVRLKKLLDFFGDLEIAWQAPLEGLMAAGLPAKVIESQVSTRQKLNLDQIWAAIEGKGVTLITWQDQQYPHRLKEIDQPPPVLYVKGSLTQADFDAIAIVGSRNMTAYGRQVTDDLARFLALNQITVVSGLARGVDIHAHQAALAGGGRTVAVLGSGVDVIYPPEHLHTAEQIIAQGALISDYALGTKPEAMNFPPRNRIISGLSIATVVIEAKETSGALITATFATEQGREVFAVPGSILSPASRGTNRLIQNGATPLLSPQDLLDVLQLKSVKTHQQARLALPMNDLEAKILRFLNHEPTHIDDVCASSEIPMDQLSATLTLMELKGLVRHTGGMNYTAIHEARADYGVN